MHSLLLSKISLGLFPTKQRISLKDTEKTSFSYSVYLTEVTEFIHYIL